VWQKFSVEERVLIFNTFTKYASREKVGGENFCKNSPFQKWYVKEQRIKQSKDILSQGQCRTNRGQKNLYFS
jgi:hypothetical protein